MWSDDRLDQRFGAIDRRLDDLQDEMRRGFAGLRGEITALRSDLTAEMSSLRGDFSSLRNVLIQVGFGLVGGLIAALAAVVVAVA